METIENLIIEFEKNNNENAFSQIINNLKTIEELWFLISEVNTTYYLEQNQEVPTVSFFSNKEIAYEYQKQLSKKGFHAKVMSNQEDKRAYLIQDMYRCGVERFNINNRKEPLFINLSCLGEIFDNFDVIIEHCKILNKSLMSSANLYLQSLEYATTEMETDMFLEINKSQYFVPVDIQGLNKDEIEAINNGSSLARMVILLDEYKVGHFPFFTDLIEYKRWEQQYKGQVLPFLVDFEDMVYYLINSKVNKNVVINPYGMNFKINEPMLMKIKKLGNEVEIEEHKLKLKKINLFIYHLEKMIILTRNCEHDRMIEIINNYISNNEEITEFFTSKEIEILFIDVIINDSNSKNNNNNKRDSILQSDNKVKSHDS